MKPLHLENQLILTEEIFSLNGSVVTIGYNL